ncbi:M16 family metallopeptidase [Caulobacter sp. KR2-114]|uniref:M16 family metallopeptidase n=1 Tax=Caulobacter sp. KR2-114 TaxID=3400912 RepID=UPI003C015B30
MAAPLIVALGISATALTGASALGLPMLGKPAATAQGTEPELKLKPGEWPQAHSDLKPDPSIRFGALPNGMRYAIMRNATPAGQASLRLRIDAGSLEETDDQQGLAHFLEHMAFRGSKGVPDGEMIKILERHGLAFGADTNAQTDFDDTIYKLDLPTTDSDTVDTSLMLLREVAGNLTLNQDAINQERGVILSEERLRDTPFYRIFKDRLAFLMPGQRPPERFPIGKVEVIQNAKREQLADFYGKYYRPERATLIAVGDFDVDAMEALIKAKFGDWQGQGPAGADPDLGRVARRGLQTSLSVQQGGPTTVQMDWMTPPDLGPDDTAQRRRDLVERLGFEVLNRRLATLARGDKPPFISAVGFRADEFRAARTTVISLTAEPDAWQDALSTAEQEQRRLVKFGVRQDELAREIAEDEASLKSAAAEASTRVTPRLADEIASTTGQKDVQTSPADDLAFFEAATKDLTAEQVSAAVRQAFEGSGPLISVSSPTGLDGGQQAIQTAYNTARGKDVTAPVAQAAVSWPYADFGPAGKVAEQREVADLDTVFVRFENGVRLTVKPTKFRDDQVLVKVRIGSGRQALPPSRQSMAWAGYAFIEGGLKKISANDTERVFASAVYGANYGLEDDANVLSGVTRRADLDTQMQVLAAYASEPGWRPEALQRMKTYTATLLDQYGATDSGVLGRDLAGLMHAGDRRWTFPSREDITSADLDALKAQMAQVTTGPIEVVVVGDITVDKAIAAVAATFGALPPRTAGPAPTVTPVNFPTPNTQPIVLTHRGRADQALGYAAWRTNDFFADPQGARNVSILGEVMQLRLLDTFRKEQSVTYSPQVGYSSSFTWPGWGYVSASVEVPPAKLPDFFANVNRIAADLRDHPITADELERAKKPRIEEAEKSRETNGYWISALSGAQTDPRRLDAIRSELPNMERITISDVQKTAQRYLRDDAQWKLEVTPAGS